MRETFWLEERIRRRVERENSDLILDIFDPNGYIQKIIVYIGLVL